MLSKSIPPSDDYSSALSLQRVSLKFSHGYTFGFERLLSVLTLAIILLASTSAHAENGLLWSRTYPYSNGEYSQVFTPTTDGGMLIAARTDHVRPGTYDVSLIKVDSDNNQEFNRLLDRPGSYVGDLLATADGGYLMVGSTVIVRNNQSFNEGWIVKLDGEFNFEWERYYGSQGMFNVVRQFTDGGFVLMGKLGNVVWLFLCDGEGNAELSTRLSGTDQLGMEITDDGNIIFMDTGNRRGRLISCYDREGNEIWSRPVFENLPEGFRGHYMSDLIKTSDGDYMVTYAEIIEDLLITKINQQGETVWVRHLNDQRYGSFGSLIALDDGGIAGVDAYEFIRFNGDGELVSRVGNFHLIESLPGAYHSVSLADMFVREQSIMLLLSTNYSSLDYESTPGDVVTADITIDGQYGGSRVWGFPGGSFESVESLFRLPFGQIGMYLLTNSSPQLGLSQAVMIVETNGDSVSVQHFEVAGKETPTQFLKPLHGGGYYQLVIKEIRGGDRESLLTKFSSDFQIEWTHWVTPPWDRGGSWNIYELMVDSNDDIVLVGEGRWGSYFIEKLGDRGQIQDTLIDQELRMANIVELENGYATLAPDCEVIFLDRNLRQQGYLDAGIPNYENTPIAMLSEANDDLVILLRASIPDQADSIYVTRINRAGERAWTTLIPSAQSDNGRTRLLRKPDGGYFVCMPGRIVVLDGNGSYYGWYSPPVSDQYRPDLAFNDYLLQPDGGIICGGYRQNDIWLAKYSLDSLNLEVPAEIEPPSSTDLSIWPNPFNARATVAYNLKQSGRLAFKLYDTQGRICRIIDLGEHRAGRGLIELDGEQLSSGLYILQMEANATRITRKVVIQK